LTPMFLASFILPAKRSACDAVFSKPDIALLPILHCTGNW
jgi:hypothetical protein